MRVLIAHNYYQRPGGEDQVAAAEAALLERHGHEVVWFRRHNDDVRRNSVIGMAVKTITTLEFLRTRVYHNRLEVFDILDDLAGISLAALVYATFRH